MLNLEEVRALGEVLNVSWGKSTDKYLKNGLKVTHNFAGDVLDLQYQTVVHFAAEAALGLQAVRQREISNEIFTSALKEIKSHFKEVTGRALKVKELNRNDDVELIQATSNSPRKIAYYRALIRLRVS